MWNLIVSIPDLCILTYYDEPFSLQLVVLFGWIVCFGILLSTVYGIYSDKDNSHIFSVGEYTAYHALHRTGWGVAVCWIVFACATGYGGRLQQKSSAFLVC